VRACVRATYRTARVGVNNSQTSRWIRLKFSASRFFHVPSGHTEFQVSATIPYQVDLFGSTGSIWTETPIRSKSGPGKLSGVRVWLPSGQPSLRETRNKCLVPANSVLLTVDRLFASSLVLLPASCGYRSTQTDANNSQTSRWIRLKFSASSFFHVPSAHTEFQVSATIPYQVDLFGSTGSIWTETPIRSKSGPCKLSGVQVWLPSGQPSLRETRNKCLVPANSVLLTVDRLFASLVLPAV
jgi:hypothetical protein